MVLTVAAPSGGRVRRSGERRELLLLLLPWLVEFPVALVGVRSSPRLGPVQAKFQVGVGGLVMERGTRGERSRVGPVPTEDPSTYVCP